MKKLLAGVLALSLVGAASAAPAQSLSVQVGPDRHHEQRYERHDDRRRYEQNRRQYERRYYSRQRSYYGNRCNPRYEEVVRDPYTGRRVCVNRQEHRSFLSFNVRF